MAPHRAWPHAGLYYGNRTGQGQWTLGWHAHHVDVWHVMAWDGMWYVMAWDGMGWYVVWDGMGWYVVCDGTGWHGVACAMVCAMSLTGDGELSFADFFRVMRR